MPLKCLKPQLFIVWFALLLCTFTIVKAQTYTQVASQIDSLARIGLPKSALLQVDKLDGLARKNNDPSQIIRAAIYRITFQSYIEEHALVTIVNTLKADIKRSAFPVKPVLQSMLANMYWRYYQQNRWQFSQRSRLQKPDPDFTRWDMQTLINETGNLYNLSLQNPQKLQSTPVEILSGVLTGDKETRYLRPTLYDLLVHRAFDFYLGEEPALPKPRTPFNLSDTRFLGDGGTFSTLSIPATDTSSTLYQGMKYLQQAIRFRINQNNPEALADLDLRRLQFVYFKTGIPQKDTLYVQALTNITQTYANKPISADARLLLGNYYKSKGDLRAAHQAYGKAVSAYPKSIGGQNAAQQIKELEEGMLSATVEETNVPNKPLLALLSYRNQQTAQVLIYKLLRPQMLKYEVLQQEAQKQRWQSAITPKDKIKQLINYLQAMKPLQDQTLSLPNLHDYRNHSAEFKIAPLPTGNYILLVKKGDNADTLLTQVTRFAISRLAYTARTNPDKTLEIRVMDRETGQPLKGVTVRQYKYSNQTYTYVDNKGVTDANGMLKTDRGLLDNAMQLTLNGDTLIDNYVNVGNEFNYVSEEPTPRTIIFTDRQIYRPGQTLYFKGLQIQVFKQKSSILPNTGVELLFKDANNKELSKLELKTNEYGTFSGTFNIPLNMLNGNIRLQTPNGITSVRVEEYKRPAFKVEFADVKESYHLNDSVKVKGSVKAFSGYGLYKAGVAYRVSRSRAYMDYATMTAIYGSRYASYYKPPAEIAADTIITDSQGNYTISFKALPDDDWLAGINYQYQITADVIDASGETHPGKTTVTVGNNDIRISAVLPEVQLAKDSAKIQVYLTSLNNQLLKGDITVQVYALQSPGRVFKNRLWQKPDQYMIGQVDFEKQFPDYAYKNEEQYACWQRKGKVAERKVATLPGLKTIIDIDALRKQSSGMYQVLIQGQAANGDTASIIRYVQIVNQPAASSTLANWVVPLNNDINVGQTAAFLIATPPGAYVLAEHYRGSKILSSGWMNIAQQRTDKIKITNDDENSTVVQYLMLYHNRIYTSQKLVRVLRPERQMNMKLVTFRNKLQPGQKEQWKVQLSGNNNEKQAAEMVAAMYDASLDDITASQKWDNVSLNGRQQLFFAWNSYNFLQQAGTEALYNYNRNYRTVQRNYEQLNLFTYNYYGGYNSGYQQYLRYLQTVAKRNEEFDKKLEQDYKKNAALVKNGYDVAGKVIGRNGLILSGVNIKINGTAISTITNSIGEFKIKVPLNGKLIFERLGYSIQEKAISKSENLTISLKPSGSSLSKVQVVDDYGSQDLKGDPGLSIDKRDQTTFTVRGMNSISAMDALELQATSIDQAVQGRVAGLQVVTEANPNEIFTSINEPVGNAPVSAAIIPVTIRKNFNETAFFYPQLHTDEKGQILIDFTMPESLTKWRFKAFAHTKELAIAYLQQDVITQKQLMISANMPRFMREGDTVTVSARVANLSAQRLKGKVELKLFNALTMQPLNLLANAVEGNQDFEMDANSNKAIFFKLIIPSGLDALTYRLTAVTDAYSDGEENTLPVLSNRMLVTESMPLLLRSGQTRQFTFNKLVNQKSATLVNKTLTLEYTQNPAWYAVQAMPYLMEFPYECSEQIFSRYYANSLSASVVNRNPQIKTVFDRWKATSSKELLSNLQKNPELKATLIEETPWLQDAISEEEQKKRIALLFDLNKLSYEQIQSLEKLKAKQLPGGGFPWFAGEYADRYITQLIIAGIGQLYHLNIAGANNYNLNSIRDNALRYLDGELLNDDLKAEKADANNLNPIEIHAWYARSYYPDKPLSDALKAVQKRYIDRAAKQWTTQNVYQQALIALTLQRYGMPGVAQSIIRSLKETAQQSDEMGMYWAKNQVGYYWYQSPVETQALIIELFTEAGNQPKAVEEMKVWLLRNKQTNNWRTTKATAAACYALLMKGDDMLTGPSTSTIKLGNKGLAELKPDIKAEAGTGYFKTTWTDEQVKPALGKVEIANNGKTISWGALHWQYAEQLDKITPSNTDIKLERKYFIEKPDNTGTVLVAVDAQHQPKTGDVLRVVVYLKAGREYEYIHLKDMRPAGTEPVDVLSAYKYQDGLYYYQVTKDVATNFFISRLNKGNYVFEYRLRVAQPGNYSTGISSVQSMYAPEFNAHSEGKRMEIKK